MKIVQDNGQTLLLSSGGWGAIIVGVLFAVAPVWFYVTTPELLSDTIDFIAMIMAIVFGVWLFSRPNKNYVLVDKDSRFIELGYKHSLLRTHTKKQYPFDTIDKLLLYKTTWRYFANKNPGCPLALAFVLKDGRRIGFGETAHSYSSGYGTGVLWSPTSKQLRAEAQRISDFSGIPFEDALPASWNDTINDRMFAWWSH